MYSTSWGVLTLRSCSITFSVGKSSASAASLKARKEVYALEKQMLEDSLAVMRAGAKCADVYEASIQAMWNLCRILEEDKQ